MNKINFPTFLLFLTISTLIFSCSTQTNSIRNEIKELETTEPYYTSLNPTNKFISIKYFRQEVNRNNFLYLSFDQSKDEKITAWLKEAFTNRMVNINVYQKDPNGPNIRFYMYHFGLKNLISVTEANGEEVHYKANTKADILDKFESINPDFKEEIENKDYTQYINSFNKLSHNGQFYLNVNSVNFLPADPDYIGGFTPINTLTLYDLTGNKIWSKEFDFHLEVKSIANDGKHVVMEEIIPYDGRNTILLNQKGNEIFNSVDFTNSGISGHGFDGSGNYYLYYESLRKEITNQSHIYNRRYAILNLTSLMTKYYYCMDRKNTSYFSHVYLLESDQIKIELFKNDKEFKNYYFKITDFPTFEHELKDVK